MLMVYQHLLLWRLADDQHIKVTEIQDPTNSNTALTIDSSGRVLTPKRSFFKLKLLTQTKVIQQVPMVHNLGQLH